MKTKVGYFEWASQMILIFFQNDRKAYGKKRSYKNFDASDQIFY